MKFLLDRIKEPSTWSALAIIGTLVGMPPGSMDLIHQVVMGGMGLVAVMLPEGQK